jgi:hypothetical protein
MVGSLRLRIPRNQKGSANVQELPQLLSVFLLAVTMLGSVASVSGCAGIAADQQAYNAQQCKNFGLTPGSDAYVQCISQGANAYAASRSNSNGSAAGSTAPGIAVFPIAIGIPVVPQPPAQNTSCSAPKSSPQGGCPGCSVSCSGQHASCTPGQEFPGGSELCLQSASCTCQ